MIPDYDNWVDFSGRYWTTPDRVYDTPNQEITQQNNVTLTQFTGLLDKNGKEIYEGDIVKAKLPYANTCAVVWDDKRAGLYLKPLDGLGKAAYDKYYLLSAAKVEVIGNIYENSDLLKCN